MAAAAVRAAALPRLAFRVSSAAPLATLHAAGGGFTARAGAMAPPPTLPFVRAISCSRVAFKGKKKGGKAAPAPPQDSDSEEGDEGPAAPDVEALGARADGVVAWFVGEAGKLRGASASAGMLDSLPVAAYGDSVPLAQVAQVALKGGSTLVVAPFDPSLAGEVARAITAAELGLNPSVDAGVVRVPVPKPSKETRAATGKALKALEEGAKVRLRRVRQGGMERAKKWGKGGGVSVDEVRGVEAAVEAAVKARVEAVAAAAAKRQGEVLGS